MASSRQMSESRQITNQFVLDCLWQGVEVGLRVGCEGGWDLHRIEQLASENIFVTVL
jgi:hypothetical protein